VKPQILVVLVFAGVVQAQDAAFFESKIRPVLAKHCYGCHSSKLPSPFGGLVLDTKAGLLKGGATGHAVVPGKPEKSRLLDALQYKDPKLQMPPTGKLPDLVVGDFARWIADGAFDPREDAPPAQASSAPLQGMSVAEGKTWWSFQPVRQVAAPVVTAKEWPTKKVDAFILAKLEGRGLKPSPSADRRTLAQRAYVDLIGLKPTFEEVEAFTSDRSPDSFERLVERLLASPHYGERWGRYWLDVARYAEDNPTAETTNPPYPFAWRYRDWVIEAINKDVPYDRFVKLQLAADLMPETSREDLRALGYLGAAPVYHKDHRLSADVVYTFLTDDWDERVDAVTRGLLGLTVACSRCHDHKFDPIPTKDYYSLTGVFASTMRVDRPLFNVDPKTEARFFWVRNRLFDLHYSMDLAVTEPSTLEDAEGKKAAWQREIDELRAEMEGLRDRYPQLVKNVERYWAPIRPPAATPKPLAEKEATPERKPRRRLVASTEPFVNAVYDARQDVDGSDASYTFLRYKPGEPRDLPVMLRGNVTSPGEPAPRGFLTVLAKGDPRFHQGSGRLELAERIFTDAAPLTARVIVNRVWAWHFGRPLVGTPSDFGTQGDKPTHPELLDDLAARFIANGWSMKWLHREIMLSSAYQQSSRPRADAEQADPTNSLLWRMNPRRLDAEAFRDTLLRIGGALDVRLYGPSEDLDDPANTRRTVYGTVSRNKLNSFLKLHDFPDASQTSPARDQTITPLQQLFVMNSAFIRAQAATVVKDASEPDAPALVRKLYRKILARDPSSKELDLALTYLKSGSADEYAQVLLASNEGIFWP
jgi:hypothetical protein